MENNTLEKVQKYIYLGHTPKLWKENQTAKAKKEGGKWTNHILTWRPRLHKRNIGRPPRRWVDDIKEKACKNWLQVAQDVAQWVTADNSEKEPTIEELTTAFQGTRNIDEDEDDNIQACMVNKQRISYQEVLLPRKNYCSTSNNTQKQSQRIYCFLTDGETSRQKKKIKY
ncbi:hypothetical protein Trydic_g4056 [Trypoxylus dichotomus]